MQNRIIKFRAWDTLREEYLSAGQVILAIQSGKNPKTIHYLDILKYPDDYKSRFILEQYTGLKDKTGKEIYEGDKVKYLNQYDSYSEGSGTAIIEIGDHSHLINGFTGRDIKTKYYITLMSTSELFKLEIIGNIHES